MKDLDPAALDALAALADAASFERAAQRLAITQSAVSQRLRTLELQVGQPLMVRSRPLRLTEPGKLLPALDALVHQGLSLELVVDDQDFTHDWLRQGEVLGCVTSVSDALRGCRVVPLGAMHYTAVASPGFIAETLPQGLTRANFAQVPFLIFNRKDDMQQQWASKAFGVRQPRLSERYVPSSEAYLRAAAMGWGIGVVPELQARALLDSGALVALRPDDHLAVRLYWHQWKLGPDGAAPSARVGLLDRVGEALLAGARAALDVT
jgi:LysR family transcriptional regulator (chromosome initiation inhibitor)